MMIKKRFSFIVTSMLFASNLYAGGMSDFANGVIQVQDSAGTISTRDRTLLYGGGYTLKVPNIQLVPFSVKAPNIKAGCGGIDMVFGSLGFLDKEQFVKFAEGIMASAPAVAFDLALKTICPSCAETLKSMQAMANQINNMSLDSCNTATALGNKALDSIVSEQTKSDLESGAVNSFFIGFNDNFINPASTSLNEFNSWMNGFTSGVNGDAPKIITYLLQDNKRSFVDYFFGTSNYFSDGIMITFLKSTLGDIYINSKPSGKNMGTFIEYNSLTPLQEYYEAKNDKIISNSEKLINRLMGADDNEGAIYSSTYTPVEVTNSNFPKGALREDFKTRINNILNKIATRTPLDADDVKFLGLFKFPVYKIFNVLGGNPYTNEILFQSRDKLANMLASQLIYELMINASRVIQMRVSELSSYSNKLQGVPVKGVIPDESGNSNLRKHLEHMARESRYVANLSYVVYAKHFADFTNALSMNNDLVMRAKQLKQLTISRSNPQMLEQLLYVKSVAPMVAK